MDSFIDLFQLREDLSQDNINHHTSLNDGFKIFKDKGTADFMKEIEVQARARTGRRCPQGPDLGFTKPTRDSFQMLHSSFAKIKSILDERVFYTWQKILISPASQPCRSNISLPA